MTLLRSVIVGMLAVALAHPVRALLADARNRVRHLAWVLLLAPFLTPVLLTGYAYANFSLSLVHHPAINTVFYAALVCWKFTPIAALILHFSPAPVSPEAVYCHRLLTLDSSANRVSPAAGWRVVARSKIRHWAFLLNVGFARGPVAAFAAVFLFAFGEFEMASLMGIKSWTVSMFDAHAGGLALSESLRRMLAPLACETAAVATAIAVLGRSRLSSVRRASRRGALPWLGWIHLSAAFVIVVMIPALVVLAGTIRGLGLVLQSFVLSREIISSLLFAAAATLLAGLAAFGFFRTGHGRSQESILGRTILFAAVFAGLLGPLVLSLAVLAAMQRPGLLFLRDTPIPLVMTLGLVLLPQALVLRLVLAMTGQRTALHLGTLMGKTGKARELIWRLSTSRKFWAMVLLFVWAYWDLTASSILAPIGMTPVTVRLYNLMHYGQVAALSAMTCAAFAAPVLIFMLAFATRRWWTPG